MTPESCGFSFKSQSLPNAWPWAISMGPVFPAIKQKHYVSCKNIIVTNNTHIKCIAHGCSTSGKLLFALILKRLNVPRNYLWLTGKSLTSRRLWRLWSQCLHITNNKTPGMVKWLAQYYIINFYQIIRHLATTSMPVPLLKHK